MGGDVCWDVIKSQNSEILIPDQVCIIWCFISFMLLLIMQEEGLTLWLIYEIVSFDLDVLHDVPSRATDAFKDGM